jgi:CubicO group peptidase (beta-lactamase class C family)
LRFRSRLGAALLLAASTAWTADQSRAGALGSPAPGAAKESRGFSRDRLARIDALVDSYVREKRIAGAVTLIARGGRVVQQGTYGFRDAESRDPMRMDTIFRIASMSKAVTTVAALMLMEEGRLQLADPVSQYLPAFANPAVALPPENGVSRTVPANRPITIRDLMTHTAGLSYGGGANDPYRDIGTNLWYFADRPEPIGAVVDRIAKVPLMAQPGEKFVYGFATDVLGRVVEVVSGLPLDVFLRTRVFEPLSMRDTSFFLPQEKRARLAVVYSATESGRIERAPEHGRVGQGDYVEGPRACFSGGAGLLSTAPDYARFLQMLADGGALGGVRLLSPKTVALATANHVGSLFEEGRRGFGLGFAIVEDVGRYGALSTPGEYGWGSAYYSGYWVIPHDDLVFLILLQLIPDRNLDLQNKFHALVEAALVAPVPGPARRPSRRRD